MRNFNVQGLIARIRLAFLMMLALAVAGCGGGGGGSSSTDCPTQYSTSCGTTGGGTTGGGTTTSAPTVSVAILDSAGAATTNLPSSGSVTVSATVKNAAGTAVKSALVTFATDTSLGVFNPASGTKLTDDNGVASVQMSAASLSAAGAGVVTATAVVDSATASGGAPYELGSADITLSNFTIEGADIPAYGTSTVSVVVNVNGSPATAPIAVNLASGCATSGKATLASTVQTVNGIATATYTDKGCNATDTITVSVLDKVVQGAIKIAGPAAANIQFVSATPSTIALKGTAGLTDVSNVIFKVVDASGNAVPSQDVEFYLTNWTGGIKLDDNSKTQVDAMPNQKVRKQTAADGTVTVTVQAGTNPTSVWVLANVLNSSLGTQSNKLIISTGLPSQDRFTLAVGVHNIEGWDYAGETTNLTVYAFDRVGNPVPEGTTVNFVTEGAGTSPSPGVCSIKDATCSINFVSAESRPRGEAVPVCSVADDSTTCVRSGRVSVLAYANGEEGFDDANGNNFFDSGETFRDMGDVFVDNNENGVWTVPEQFFPFVTASDNASLGLACPTHVGYEDAKSKLSTCNNKWGQAQVRREQVIILSGSHVNFAYRVGSNIAVTTGPSGQVSGLVVTDGFGGLAQCSAMFQVRIADLNNNPLPAGTKLSITNNNVKYSQSGSSDPVTVIAEVANDTVLDTTTPGGTTHAFTMLGAKCASTPKGTVSIRAVTPKGNITAIPVAVN